MADHLSSLALDELASGEPGAADPRAHLEACALCRAQLESLLAARERLAASAPYRRVLQNLQGVRQPPPRRFLAAWFAAPLAVAAAMLVLTVTPRFLATRRDGARLKGPASLQVLPAGVASPHPITRAKPKDQVVLSVGAAGHPYGLVAGVDGAGQVSVLWPLQGTGALPAGAAVRLEPGFEVTAGSLCLWAFFSDAPLEPSQVRSALAAAAQARILARQTPLELELPLVAGEAARAKATLTVEDAL